MARNYREPKAGKFEYDLLQSLQGANSAGEVTQVLKNVPLDDIPASLLKELTWQLPTDDIAAAGTSALTSFWDKQINPFALQTENIAQGLVDVGDNQFTPGGQLGADLLLMGIGFEMWGEAECWVLPGVSVLNSEITAGTATGVSPDAYTTQDRAANNLAAPSNGAIGASTQPAQLDFGRYTWRAAENFADGYNFVFRVAQSVRIIDESAANIASCGTRRMSEGFSRADTDTPWYVDQVNQTYSQIPGYTNRTFVAQNAVRDGFVPGAGGIGTFIPSRAGDFAKVAFGAFPQHKLYSNPCSRFFDNPLYMHAGRPYQIFLEQTGGGNTYVDRFLADMGATFNGAMTAIDANTFAFGNLPAAASGIYNEWDSRAAVPAVSSHTLVGPRMVYKWGQLRMKICLYGALLTSKALSEMVGKAMLTGVSGKDAGWKGVSENGQHLGGVVDADSIRISD